MDYTRPPIPQGAPPAYAAVNRVYKKSLRPVVLFTATLGALWSLASAISAFRSYSYDHDNLHSLAPFALALGIIYLVALFIEIFGVFAAYSQKLAYVRLYAFASVLAALCVVGASLVEVVTHFTFKTAMINQCTSDATGDTVFSGWGFWGHSSSETLDAAEASDFCHSAWNHDSWADIVSMLIIAVLAGLSTTIALAYAHQALDPSHSRLAAPTAPQNYPVHYNPPYAASVPELGYDAPSYAAATSAYAPPPGPPPAAPAYGYGVGTGSGAGAGGATKGNGSEEFDFGGHDDKSDPFADFERVPRAGGAERDVTSPGQRAGEGFHI